MDSSLGKFAKLFNAGLVFYVGNDKTRTRVTAYNPFFIPAKTVCLYFKGLFMSRYITCSSQ